MIDNDILQARLQLAEVRTRMSASILLTGHYDGPVRVEHDALSCSIAGLQETYQCLQDQIEVEEQSLQKETKQLRALRSKMESER